MEIWNMYFRLADIIVGASGYLEPGFLWEGSSTSASYSRDLTIATARLAAKRGRNLEEGPCGGYLFSQILGFSHQKSLSGRGPPGAAVWQCLCRGRP